jgi:peptidoglycan/xylan/chitin deacetylase (PgdA/CDA1 family)
MFISLAAVIAGCMPASGPDREFNKADIPDLSGSALMIEDLDGGDLYPGDSIGIKLILKNNGGEVLEDISLKPVDDTVSLVLDDMPGLEDKQAGPGETLIVEGRGHIGGGIRDDIYGSASLDIFSGKKNIFRVSEDIEVLGVAEYERGLIPIIGLHAIEEEIEIPIELSTTNFEVLCRTLKDFGYQTITFEDLLKHMYHGRALPERSVIITSDDGYQDNYSQAFPVLKEYGYVMTVFLVTGVIGEDEGERMPNTVFNKRTDTIRPMLIWPEIEEMDEYGCEFLSHTENHIRLGLAPDEEVLDELITSRETIESRLGKDVEFFAWPFDNYSEDKWPLIEEAGYEGAVRYWGGIEDIRKIDLNNIKRVEFNSYIAPSHYAGYLNLFDLHIESLAEKTAAAGEVVELEYRIKNYEDTEISIASLELELSENLLLEDILQGSDIEEFPGLSQGIFMWVGGGYEVGAGEELILKISLKAVSPGEAGIRFRVSAFDSYVEADAVEINITR